MRQKIDVLKGGVRGLLITRDRDATHDVVVYYVHGRRCEQEHESPLGLIRSPGGGFSMGSPYFYLEPLLVLYALLTPRYKHPAVFALEYDLVPDSVWPTQVTQVKRGYHYVSSLVGGDCGRICVSGDSAGGTLVLSLLLKLSFGSRPSNFSPNPGYAVLLSPWVTLHSEYNRNTASDYLDADALHKYACQYAGNQLYNPEVSPGCCNNMSWWKGASPQRGLHINYGSEEVFAPEIARLFKRLRKAGVKVSVNEEPGMIHAWKIARLFLGATLRERLRGMDDIAALIAANIRPKPR